MSRYLIRSQKQALMAALRTDNAAKISQVELENLVIMKSIFNCLRDGRINCAYMQTGQKGREMMHVYTRDRQTDEVRRSTVWHNGTEYIPLESETFPSFKEMRDAGWPTDCYINIA